MNRVLCEHKVYAPNHCTKFLNYFLTIHPLTFQTGPQTSSNSISWKLAAAAKLLQSCPTLCDPIDGSLPGSSIPGILQARTLEWVAVSFSNAWKWKVKVKSLSRARLSVTPWTAAYQAPPSMGFSRQEYWRWVVFPSPRDLPWPRDLTDVYCIAGGFFIAEPLGALAVHKNRYPNVQPM